MRGQERKRWGKAGSPQYEVKWDEMGRGEPGRLVLEVELRAVSQMSGL